MLNNMGVEIIDRVSYTLYDPRDIIKANGGAPPLTFGKGEVGRRQGMNLLHKKKTVF
jgi:hypothetical protein